MQPMWFSMAIASMDKCKCTVHVDECLCILYHNAVKSGGQKVKAFDSDVKIAGSSPYHQNLNLKHKIVL